jgi:hypothetical protein
MPGFVAETKRKKIACYWSDFYEALIRYYGHYANAARGKRKKLGLESQPLLNIIDDAPNKKTCRRSWAQLIYQVYEIDPLKCPNPAELDKSLR